MSNVTGTLDSVESRPALPDRGRRLTLAASAVLLLVSSENLVPGKHHPSPARPNRGDRANLGEANRLSGLCSSSNAVGIGLRGEYFSKENWLGRPSATRIDTTIDFNSSRELAEASGVDRIGSVRWTGWIKAHVTGRFGFDGGSPRVQIIVSNILLSGPQATAASDLQISAGRYYPVRVEVNRILTTQYPICLKWTTPYGAHYVVPRQLLFLPTDSIPSTHL